ncbi:MAG: aminotransferase class I/II-fold pyridoxal phosphate-dependent enzyme, partial [Candidatus Eremiobacteraeota bacterium]|nr:aminotransferase class I/II-fold pyridoxal phosphate-dependent enzyme [Candidatus Eremiobacteraeota bacterium]
EKGDDVVSTVPAFPPARATLDAVGASVHELRLRFENAYQPDLGEFSQQLSERTRVVSIASPQNPSGVLFSTRILNEMLEIMNDRCPDAYLLVDETYREAAYGSNFVTETACGLSPKIISIASLSKCHGVPGLRIGWAITRDSQLRKQLLLGKFNSVISCSPLDEALAFNVLQHSERIMKDRRLSLDAGLSRTASWVYENGLYLKWVRPDAGAICAVRLEPAVFDDAAVRRFYDEVTRNGVRIASGTWFGDEARVFRLGFGLLPKPDYEAALEVLSAALRRSSRTPGRRAS